MDEMYQTLIIEHDRSPRNFKRLDAPTHHAEGRNPLCGDEGSLDLVVDAEGRIIHFHEKPSPDELEGLKSELPGGGRGLPCLHGHLHLQAGGS
mgnify:CR=1 FL=1